MGTAQTRAKNKWLAKNTTILACRLKKEDAAVVKEHAEKVAGSVNAYLLKLIAEDMRYKQSE